MGLVKIDIHKDERPFEIVTLSDPETIEALIVYRYKFDPCYRNKYEMDIDKAGNVQTMNQEAISLYASLDSAIEEAQLTPQQKYILWQLEDGYNYGEIGDWDYASCQRIAKTAFKKILRANNLMWKRSVHKTILESDMKVCSSCKKDLPKTSDFFGKDPRNKDGFKSICKNCDNYTKKQQ